MPNNTTNVLKITASKSDFDKIQEFVRNQVTEDGKTHEILFDFNKIIPMPPELKNVSSPTNIVSQEDYDKAFMEFEKNPKDRWFLALPLTQKMYDEYMKKYGYANWYDWSLENWGTKWNAYDFGEWKDQTLTFCTAWSPPFPVINELSKKFPNATFTLQYADEGCGYVGTSVFKNGEHEENCMTNSSSPEFRELFCELTGSDEEEVFGND